METQKQKEVRILATFATTATKTPAKTRFHLVATLWQPVAKPATQVAKTHLFHSRIREGETDNAEHCTQLRDHLTHLP